MKDIESLKNEREIERETQIIALEKNNKELDRICKKYCLCIGWFLVLFLFIYVIIITINKPS